MKGLRGPLKSSANAGQFSEDLLGKVNLKQYYSAAKIMRGVEPVPQSGFSLLPGTIDVGALLSPTCKPGVLRVNADLSYTLFFTAGKAEIWRDDRVKVATKDIAAITLAMIPDLEFFGEANSFGIFHKDLNNGIPLRLSRNAGDDTVWTLTSWPLVNIPMVDLGGSYSKTDDIWEIYIRWVSATPGLEISLTVDGTVLNAVSLVTAGTSTKITPDAAVTDDWTALAAAMQAAIAATPGFSSGVTVTNTANATRYRVFRVTFGGALSGAEYDFDAQINNTSDASALVTHVQRGDTEGEALVSASQGGFSGMAIYQDRGVYWSPKAKPAALAMSQIGEYFNLNIESQADNGPRLESLRSDTAETIRHVLDNTYLLVFTDQAEWFASNRTVNRNDPLNWVRASEIGSRKNCKPVNIDGLVFFVAKDGGILYSTTFDAVSTTYVPTPENDLCKDLLSQMANQVQQRKIGASTSSRNWILRDDGRMVCLIVNKAREQNIIAPAEWGCHGGGTIKAHVVDGREQVWLVVERDGAARVEMMQEASENLLQAAIAVTTNASGIATGLDLHEGRAVWAEIAGDFFGPFTVVDGAITTEMPASAAIVGIWEPPVFDSMPYVKVLPDDTIVRRPGAVKAAQLYVIDTDSIAIGANGRPAKNIPLNRMTDDLSASKRGFTGDLLVAGLNGVSLAPTITITQTRPGRLRLRDYIPGVKL